MTNRKIIHIDMDCFYAAIEMRDNPELREIPLAIGGSQHRRGVLCTCNYVARKWGCRSAMATAVAYRLCPDLTVLPPRMSYYKQVSQQIQAIYAQYTHIIEPLSLDEAYMDVSDAIPQGGSATALAQHIRQHIFKELQLTASAGVSCNKFLAKVASDWNKPNGQCVIAPGRIAEFMHTLPVNKIPGVGKVTLRKCHELGIFSCADLQACSFQTLSQHFGKFGAKLYHRCRGEDQRPVETVRERKSFSVEKTYAKDLADLQACLEQLPALLHSMEQRGIAHFAPRIKNQYVKVKFADFSQTTAECASENYGLAVYQQLCEQAFLREQKPVRLLGMGVRLHEALNPQQCLF